MPPRKKPTAIVQWWLDKRADLQRQLALAHKNRNAREIRRLQNITNRIDVMLADMRRYGLSICEAILAASAQELGRARR